MKTTAVSRMFLPGTSPRMNKPDQTAGFFAASDQGTAKRPQN